MNRIRGWALALFIVFIVLVVWAEFAEENACEARGGTLLRDAAGRFVCVDVERIR